MLRSQLQKLVSLLDDEAIQLDEGDKKINDIDLKNLGGKLNLALLNRAGELKMRLAAANEQIETLNSQVQNLQGLLEAARNNTLTK
jgi:hypothetical protein